MFEINLLGSTFEKISRKEIQAFDMTGSRAPEVSKVFCFKGSTCIHHNWSSQATCRAEKLGRSATLSIGMDWIRPLRYVFSGGLFARITCIIKLQGAKVHDTERGCPLLIGKRKCRYLGNKL